MSNYESAQGQHIHYVGIDAPKGLAVWCGQEKCFHLIETTDFWGIISTLSSLAAQGNIVAVVEDPGINKPMFWAGKKSVGGRNSQLKIAQNVGMNKQTATLIIEYLKLNNISHRAVPPMKGILKMWKKDVDLFKQQTKYIQPTSEHGRDAAALVWGR